MLQLLLLLKLRVMALLKRGLLGGVSAASNEGVSLPLPVSVERNSQPLRTAVACEHSRGNCGASARNRLVGCSQHKYLENLDERAWRGLS